MRIEFDFPTFTHPNSDSLKVNELAEILEKKQDICKNFAKWIEPRFNQRCIELVKNGIQLKEIDLQAWVKDQWDAYGVEGNFGYSKKAQEEGRQPFIDTGTFKDSMLPYLIFTPQEKKLLNIVESPVKITR